MKLEWTSVDPDVSPWGPFWYWRCSHNEASASPHHDVCSRCMQEDPAAVATELLLHIPASIAAMFERQRIRGGVRSITKAEAESIRDAHIEGRRYPNCLCLRCYREKWGDSLEED